MYYLPITPLVFYAYVCYNYNYIQRSDLDVFTGNFLHLLSCISYNIVWLGYGRNLCLINMSLILAHELWFCVLILWLDKIMCLKLYLEFESFYTNHHMSWLPSLCDLHSNVYNSTYEELITWPIRPSWKTQPVSKDK